MLISRCAWHPRNYGHTKLLGIASWRGLTVGFTDGICPKCAERVRSPRKRGGAGRPPIARGGGRISAAVVVSLGVVTGLLMAAQPANEGAGRFADPADWLPRPVTTMTAMTPTVERPGRVRTAVQTRRPKSGPRVVTVSARGYRGPAPLAREVMQSP